jgi:hypothetical protein
MACRHKRVINYRRVHPDEPRFGLRSMCGCADCSTIADAIQCRSCRHWIPLGPAADEDQRVKVEIRAAEIAANVAELTEWYLYVGINTTDAENRGYACAESSLKPHNDEWHAGYLARCITEHGGES